MPTAHRSCAMCTFSRRKVGYLADQPLVPFTIAGGGGYRTVRPTPHTLTNIEIVRTFLDVDIAVQKEDGALWTIAIHRTAKREVDDES